MEKRKKTTKEVQKLAKSKPIKYFPKQKHRVFCRRSESEAERKKMAMAGWTYKNYNREGAGFITLVFER